MDESLAFVDYLAVAQGGRCGAVPNKCLPSVHLVGHCENGSEAAFLLTLRSPSGKLLAYSAMDLMATHADGVLITSARCSLPPWRSCEFSIFTAGAGGPLLSHYLPYDLARFSGTYVLQAFASPVERITTPNGEAIRRFCLDEWNWDGGQAVELRVWCDGRTWHCTEATAGALPPYQSPKISDLTLTVADNEGDHGWASVVVDFATDVPAQAQAYFGLAQEGGAPGDEMGVVCDPFSGWGSGVSPAGTEHSLELPGTALYYDKECTKDYCLQVVAWLPKYRYVDWAKTYGEIVSFTLP